MNVRRAGDLPVALHQSLKPSQGQRHLTPAKHYGGSAQITSNSEFIDMKEIKPVKKFWPRIIEWKPVTTAVRCLHSKVDVERGSATMKAAYFVP